MKRSQERTVNAFDAKTHLGQLLAEAERGRSVTITRRGKPVARLVPYTAGRHANNVDQTLAFLRELRARVAKRGRPLKIRSLIDAGRRY
jgi:prevent-host-death family protein